MHVQKEWHARAKGMADPGDPTASCCMSVEVDDRPLQTAAALPPRARTVYIGLVPSLPLLCRPGSYAPSTWRTWMAEYVSDASLGATLASLTAAAPYTFPLALRRTALLYVPPAPGAVNNVDGAAVDLTTGRVTTFTAVSSFLREQGMAALVASRQVLINGGMVNGDAPDMSTVTVRGAGRVARGAVEAVTRRVGHAL